jgi:Kef-type K+ transport system membrane component KefB
VRLEGIGYGFFVPVFFIATGMRLPTENLLTLEALGLVAGYTVLLLIIRGLPAILYRRHLGRRGTIAAGLMQATNLSFVVVAVSFGLQNDLIAPLNGSALVIAGLVSAIAFPAVAQSLIARDHDERLPNRGPC